ncbi:MAG TPA: DeoR/GlpR family DNA-binding transcription regulator [Opitutaceae bacterium]|nr:DeoR/GlpR family DNA-binding transcription regulator [Opitutaceae bacterium]
MLAPERHRQILRILGERGRVTAAEICSRLGVSVATARRDVTELSGAGLATRTRGALLPHDFSLVEPPYTRKTERAVTAKVRLGRAAAALVPEVGTVFVDAGTTCLEVGRALLDRAALRIFTNSVPLLALAGEARATVSAVGGEVRPMSLALTGALAQSWLENLRFDVAVVGASGIDGASGASTTEVAEAAVKAEALRRARRRILVAHSEKWGRPSALRFAAWSAFTDFVTDRALSRDERIALNGAQVRVHAVSCR